LHPIAGQGLNLGLRDVALLAELVAGQLLGNEDPGSEKILDEYAEGRQSDRHWITRFTDLLARSLTPRYARLSGLRSLGLLSLDLLPFIKGALAKRTMGLAGYQPRLVRGLPLDRSMSRYSEPVQ
jgi:2-octaprenyl-6-methoxyphenol hydroxylase